MQCYSMSWLKKKKRWMQMAIGWKFWMSHGYWAGNYNYVSREVRAGWGPSPRSPHLPWWASLCEWRLFYHIFHCSCDVSKCRKSGMSGTTWRRGFRKSGKFLLPSIHWDIEGGTCVCWVPPTKVCFLSWPRRRRLEDSNSCYDIHHTFGLGLTSEEQEVR